jgi:alkanesulfonate monooxygenase SsuD/methylene tetrahydromethanopterin reductase-like flavin-dependent oxidoreductase (luciferase family)
MEPKPIQRPHPPVWFGATGETALRRAAWLGDGFFGSGGSATERFAEQVRIVRAALAEAGRDAAGFPIAKRVYIVVDDNSARARDRANSAIAQMYGRRVPDLEAAAVAGTPAECAALVAAVAAAGAQLILFHTLVAPGEQAARIAADVIPLLT